MAETVAGGKYIQNGRYVNANGEDLGPVEKPKSEPKEKKTTSEKDKA